MREASEERLPGVTGAIAKGEEPKHRDVRPHRRTLRHRARKDSQFTLTITDRRLFQISNDGQILSSRQCGFSVRLRSDQSLQFLDIRSIQLVAAKGYRPSALLHRRHYCLHVQVAVPEPVPLEKLDIQSPEDVLGADRGRKTTYRSARDTAPIIRVPRNKASAGASTGDTSPANPATANDGNTPLRSTENMPGVTPSTATRRYADRSGKSSWTRTRRWLPSKACTPSA